mmetsp:Transcript_89495/g.175155  ORF Transcript_89495/g.175155 Transcript_89495/m.175155 type:complete len:236 (-) Transcript_89495:398-1105(-)
MMLHPSRCRAPNSTATSLQKGRGDARSKVLNPEIHSACSPGAANACASGAPQPAHRDRTPSPTQLPADAVLFEEALVIRLQRCHIRHLVALGVQVELIELLHPLLSLLVLRSLEVRVRPPVVPRVEGVEPDHVQASFGDRAAVLLQDPVHVLVVAPRHHELGDAAARLVHAVLAAVYVVGEVRVRLEGLPPKDALLRRRAAHGEGIAHDGPLRQRVLPGDLRQGQDLAHVVEQAH